MSARNVIGGRPGQWGSASTYSTIKQGTCVSVHPITSRAKSIRLVWSGMGRGSGLTAEQAFGPYELIATVERCDASGNVIGPKVPVLWGSRRWLKVDPFSEYESNPIPWSDAGWVKVTNWVNILKSDDQTINGETGQLTSNSPFWPQHVWTGGSLGANGVCGCEPSTSPTFNAATCKVDSGAVVVSNPHGVPPCAILGSTYEPLAVITDSIGNGSNDWARPDQAYSGRGFIHRMLADDFPFYHASQNGMALFESVGVNVASITKRMNFIRGCRKALVCLGTNDAARGRTAEQIIADATAFIAYLKSEGIQEVVFGSIIARGFSTNGYQDLAGQFEFQPGFQAKINQVNDWLANAAPIDGFADYRLAVQTDLTSGKLIPSEVIGDFTAAVGSTVNSIRVEGVLPAGQLVGYHVLIGSQTSRVNAQSSASGVTTLSMDRSFSSAPAPGSNIRVLAQMLCDGTHPAMTGHKRIAETFNTDLLLFG